MTRTGMTVLTALLTAVAFLAPAAPASASAATGTPDRITAHSTADLVVPPAARADGRSSLAPGSTPPGGGCTWRVHVAVSSDYANHVLTDTSSAFDSSSTCRATAPGQTMEEMSMRMELMINGKVRKNSESVFCSNPTPSAPACLALSDSDTSFCIVPGPYRCDGVYHGVTWVTFLLPDGWFYTSTPRGCTMLGDGQELYCQLLTTPVVVSPTV